VRTAALSGLQFARSDEALPLIIEATRDDSPRVVSQASMALGQYDTPESVAALIALTRSPDADIRTRAAIDLDDSRRPEAKQALKRLLDDPDPTVRAHAPRRFFGLLRRGQADDVVPTLISMLDDPVDEVRAAAAHALGESRNSAAVEPLVGVLQREAIGPGTEDWTLKALALLYTRAGPEARRVIEFNLDLIIASLKRGQWHASWGAAEILGSAKTPQAIAALEWAAEEHPLPGVRDLAAHLLGRVRVP
jgi:HEAT repeat protein